MSATTPVVAVNSDLARFQDAFARTLLDSSAPPDAHIANLVSQPAFAVYRNTVMKGCIDAVQANFPAVTRLVGEEWMRAAAADYVRTAPPTDPALLHYGASFADFLAHFEPAAEFPYLPGVARLDRCWIEAHTATDENAIDPAVLAALAPERLANAILRPHAAARWAWFPGAPIYNIWSGNRGDAAFDSQPVWKADGVLITRPRNVVTWIELDAAGYAFMDACAAGLTVADAADAALATHGEVDFARMMSALMTAGAFGAIRHTAA